MGGCPALGARELPGDPGFGDWSRPREGRHVPARGWWALREDALGRCTKTVSFRGKAELGERAGPQSSLWRELSLPGEPVPAAPAPPRRQPGPGCAGLSCL